MNRHADRILRLAIETGALEFGPHTLKGGRVTPYFFNTGKFYTRDSIIELAHLYAQVCHDVQDIDVVFGMAYKGIPLAVETAIEMSLLRNRNISYAFNRKEEKGYAEGGMLIGAPMMSKRVLILDDALTTNESCTDGVLIVAEQGGVPVGCVVAFDRQEECGTSPFSAADDFRDAHGFPVRAIATLGNLVDLLSEEPEVHPDGNEAGRAVLKEILAYREEYGSAPL